MRVQEQFLGGAAENARVASHRGVASVPARVPAGWNSPAPRSLGLQSPLGVRSLHLESSGDFDPVWIPGGPCSDLRVPVGSRRGSYPRVDVSSLVGPSPCDLHRVPRFSRPSILASLDSRVPRFSRPSILASLDSRVPRTPSPSIPERLVFPERPPPSNRHAPWARTREDSAEDSGNRSGERNRVSILTQRPRKTHSRANSSKAQRRSNRGC